MNKTDMDGSRRTYRLPHQPRNFRAEQPERARESMG